MSLINNSIILSMACIICEKLDGEPSLGGGEGDAAASCKSGGVREDHQTETQKVNIQNTIVFTNLVG